MRKRPVSAVSAVSDASAVSAVSDVSEASAVSPERPLTRMARLRLWPRRVLMAAVRGYRYGLSPWLGSSCRFEPSCSAYALQALQHHGARRGCWLTAARLLRCHPYCEGGCDPVPAAFSLFTRLPGLGADTPSSPPRSIRKSP